MKPAGDVTQRLKPRRHLSGKFFELLEDRLNASDGKDRKVRKDVSIVIPLYNEAGCLKKNIAALVQYCETQAFSWDLLLINDGSTDDTAGIGRKIAESHRAVYLGGYSINRGKGHAVKTGMLKATGRVCIFMDADLAVPVEFIGNCLHQFQKGTDIVIGSRHLRDSVYKVPEGFLRTFLGRAYRKFTLALFGLTVSDITCGLKGFSAGATEAIFSRSRVERWGYDAEVLFIAEKLGYTIREIPVDWTHSFDSNVRLGQDIPRTFSEMLTIWANYKKGRYRLS